MSGPGLGPNGFHLHDPDCNAHSPGSGPNSSFVSTQDKCGGRWWLDLGPCHPCRRLQLFPGSWLQLSLALTVLDLTGSEPADGVGGVSDSLPDSAWGIRMWYVHSPNPIFCVCVFSIERQRNSEVTKTSPRTGWLRQCPLWPCPGAETAVQGSYAG